MSGCLLCRFRFGPQTEYLQIDVTENKQILHTDSILSVFLPDERCLGESEPNVEGEDGAAGGGHDRLSSVPGRPAGPLRVAMVTLQSSESGLMFYYIYLCLQSMFDYLDNAVIKLCDMSTVGTDLGTVKQQIEELKVGPVSS